MIHFERLTIPEVDLELLDGVEQFMLVTNTLDSAGVSPKQLVYCGIEGVRIYDGEDPPVLDRMFGYSHDEFKGIVEEEQRYGSSGIGESPVYYAMLASNIPAIITYDVGLLKASTEEADVWTPTSADTLRTATRAIIFFT